MAPTQRSGEAAAPARICVPERDRLACRCHRTRSVGLRGAAWPSPLRRMPMGQEHGRQPSDRPGGDPESASERISTRIEELGDWRGRTLQRVRELIKEADPEVIEEWKWMGTPVWSHNGLICTGETYKNIVKLTFAKGASVEDPSGLFNSSLDGKVRRAIDIREGDTVNEAALKDLIRAAVSLNLKGK